MNIIIVQIQTQLNDSIKEKNIEKINESFCDSLDLDLDNSF
jgi:hypothetical protein